MLTTKYFEKKRENEKILKEILKFCVVFVFINGKKREFTQFTEYRNNVTTWERTPRNPHIPYVKLKTTPFKM